MIPSVGIANDRNILNLPTHKMEIDSSCRHPLVDYYKDNYCLNGEMYWNRLHCAYAMAVYVEYNNFAQVYLSQTGMPIDELTLRQHINEVVLMSANGEIPDYFVPKGKVIRLNVPMMHNYSGYAGVLRFISHYHPCPTHRDAAAKRRSSWRAMMLEIIGDE